ncbi:unnamed protein product [Tenebrio molitor]|nr:unnamed protein product [Tenebrio molitor]
MKETIDEEKQLAIERGDVDENGVPLLTVVADGSWAKRSYKCNYSSLSGMASIIGFHTGKVLCIGVRNIFCLPCRLAEKRQIDTPNYTCFKNCSGSPNAMESDIIVKVFNKAFRCMEPRIFV